LEVAPEPSLRQEASVENSSRNPAGASFFGTLRFEDGMADRVKTCPDCNGDGVVDKDKDDERQCPTCGGLGFVRDDDDYEEVIKTCAA
jgi:DnaJ-class molecular chaperone